MLPTKSLMMKLHFKRFLLQTTAITAGLFIIGGLYVYFQNPGWFHGGFVFLLFGYMLFSWIIQYLLFHYGDKSPAVFNRAFMAITGIKLILLLVLMVLVGFLLTPIFKYFLIELLSLYLLFSFIEVRSVLKFVKSKSKTTD